MEKRTQLITVWGVIGSIFVASAIVWWIAAAPKGSNLPHWPAVPFVLVGIAGLYLMFAALWCSWPYREIDPEPPPVMPEPSPPDLASAADARIQAVMTSGPARNSRLSKSRLDLQRAADTLGKDAQSLKARALARELADCTNPAKAADLREQLVQAADANTT
jgi:hypothetical protein